MKIDFGIKSIAALIIFSVTSLVLHRNGLFVIQLDLLDQNFIADSVEIEYGSATIELENTQKQYSGNCRFDKSQSMYAHCGFSLNLTEENANNINGVDLSRYDSIKIDVNLEGPDSALPIRFILRNFNTKYSTLDDEVSSKFNTLEFIPNKNLNTIDVPLDAFQVERWWIYDKKIPFKYAQIEFENVYRIEVITSNLNIPGDYTITLKKAVLSGNALSESSLLRLVLVTWLIFILLFTLKQRSKLERISNTDPLTGLLNRRGINKFFAANKFHYFSKRHLSLLYFDIDDFKRINDSLGHLIGDELLCHFANIVNETMLDSFEASDIKHRLFSRLSGDEFILVLFNIPSKEIELFAKNVIHAISVPVSLTNCEIKINASIGIASSNNSVRSFDELVGQADAAMYLAKKQGKNQYKVFDEQVAEGIYQNKKLAEHLQVAVQDDLFYLVFMPIFDAKSRLTTRAEVLIRSEYPPLKECGPAAFIPIAEEYGIIEKIDMWVFESVCKLIADNASWLAANKHFKFCINVSAMELHNKQFTKQVKHLLNKYKIQPKHIEIEITETSLIAADEMSCGVLNELDKLGFSLALDDFGTGYTAFGQLVSYPINCLKIDRSFVSEISVGTGEASTIINAIISIAKSYQLETIAEGVETESQYQHLLALGCDMMQGYHFSNPIHFNELTKQAWQQNVH